MEGGEGGRGGREGEGGRGGREGREGREGRDDCIHILIGRPLCSIDSIHGQRNPHRERGLAGMGNGCFAEFCCCVPLCPCELRYSSSKDISFHRFPADKVAGRECIFKSRRDMPLL